MKPATIMFAYALFLFWVGLVGWAMTGFSRSSESAVVMASALSAPMLACGGLALSLEARPRSVAICVYLGMLFTLIIAALYTWRTLVAFHETQVAKGMNTGMIAVAGLVACYLIYLNHRPASASQ